MSSIPRRKWWRRQCQQPCQQRQWYWHCLFLWWEWPSFLYLHGKFRLILQLMLKCFLDWPSPTTFCPTPWAGQQVASSIFSHCLTLHLFSHICLTLYYNTFFVVVDSVTAWYINSCDFFFPVFSFMDQKAVRAKKMRKSVIEDGQR